MVLNPTMLFLIRMVFALSFLAVRIVWWYPLTANLVYDWSRYFLMTLENSEENSQESGGGAVMHGPFVVGLNFLVILVLTMLQTLWGSLVVKGLLKAIRGGKDAKDLDKRD